jgi:tetratricopeptide (TPR) repeat protein
VLLISCNKDKANQLKQANNKFYDKAWDFLDGNIPDSSFVYFNKAKEEFSKNNDSIGLAKCLINMAIVSGDMGDYYGGQELSISAIKYLNAENQSNHVLLAANYNNLGKIAQTLKKFNDANHYYNLSLSLDTNENAQNIYLNNIAINLTDQKKYDESIKYFDQLLVKKSIKSSNINFARVLSNREKTRWLKNPKYNAAPNLLIALNIREKENYLLGKNASYSHLTDFYTFKKPDSALYYAGKMYQNAIVLKSPDDQIEALHKLIKLSRGESSKIYFNRYQILSDSVQQARNTAKNEFALIKYETEKSKAENLKLQRDNLKQKYLLITLISISTIIIVSGIFWYIKRKQHLVQRAENLVKQNQLKTSKKVHDVVANGLYRVMTEIENQSKIDKERILDQIEDLYEKSRDIAYDKERDFSVDFKTKVSLLITSFATDDIQILIVGNEVELWAKINAVVQYEVEHILQELMVNMKKHSRANKVSLMFEEINNEINIHYYDNGVGFNKNQIFSNGLRNTGNRIENINGAITFDTDLDKGLKIKISIPLS